MDSDQIVAWATVGLAVAAITLSMITFLMAGEARYSRELNIMPLCTCELTGATSNSSGAAPLHLSLENIGNSAALETRVDVFPSSDSKKTPIESWFASTIANGSRRTDTHVLKWPSATVSPTTRLVINYRNTHHAHFRTVADFQLESASGAPTNLVTDDAHWVKTSETFRLIQQRWWYLGH